MLIDGPGSLRGRTGCLSDRAVVFVENLREPQRRDLDAILPAPWTSRSSWPVLTTENLGGYHVYQLRPTSAERISFGLRGRGQQAAGTVRPWVRRGLTKARLTPALDWFARRADRGRISEAEYRDAGVMHEGD